MELQQPAGPEQHPLALSSSLRWLQVCLLLLFGHDVLCFSLGYPFLPLVFGGAATGLAFSCYGLASIAVLLLLLFSSSSSSRAPTPAGSSSSTSHAASAAAAKFWRIMAAAALAAAAGVGNTVLPSSYAVLLLTKAVQGAASALYFCDSLSLVAAVYPRAYRTQAMAFISAGLTVGDALGPVLGGLVYEAAGLQVALGLQPAASLLAVVVWSALLVWPSDKRPWGAGCAVQQQQQKQQQCSPDEEQGYSALPDCRCCGSSSWGTATPAGCQTAPAAVAACRDRSCHQAAAQSSGSLGPAVSACLQQEGLGLLEPLLRVTAAAAAASDPHASSPFDTAARVCCCHRHHQQQQHQQRHLPAAATAAVDGLQPSSAAAAATSASPSRPQLLLQLLSLPSISSLCLLAFMAQAARTAVDLLLPMMLSDQVQPGVIGLLFAGEAVGSVVAPFFVDWLLHRHSNTSRNSCSSSHRRASAEDSTKPTASAAAAAGATHQQQAKSMTNAHKGKGGGSNTHGSCSSSSGRFASWLLLLSTVGMALCCALVLTLWQLPAALHVTAAAVHPGPWVGAHYLKAHTPAAFEARFVQSGPFPFTTSDGIVAHQRQTQAGMHYTAAAKQPNRSSSSFDEVLELFFALKSLQHPQLGARIAVQARAGALTASNATSRIDSAAIMQDLDVDPSVLLDRSVSVGEESGEHSGSGQHGSFGLVELFIIGAVLMALGSCHSSCETLIYSVLTDIITPSDDATTAGDCAGSDTANSDMIAKQADRYNSSYDSRHGVLVASGSECCCRLECVQSTQTAAGGGRCGPAQQQTQGCLLHTAGDGVLGGVGVYRDGVVCTSVAAVSSAGFVDASSVVGAARTTATPTIGSASASSHNSSVVDAHECGVAADELLSSVDGSSTSVSGAGSAEVDIEVQIGLEGSSSYSNLKLPQSWSCQESENEQKSEGGSESGRRTCDVVAGAAPQQPVDVGQRQCQGVTGCDVSAQPSGLDYTEVVMVLYVLFWVMGFSAGAGVVGLLPGNSIGQLQALAAVLGAVLAVAGRWSWVAVSA